MKKLTSIDTASMSAMEAQKWKVRLAKQETKLKRYNEAITTAMEKDQRTASKARVHSDACEDVIKRNKKVIKTANEDITEAEAKMAGFGKLSKKSEDRIKGFQGLLMKCDNLTELCGLSLEVKQEGGTEEAK